MPAAPGFGTPLVDDVRLVELAWRALRDRDALDELEYRGLLEGKRSNPLLGIIAGYRLYGTARAAQFSGPMGSPRTVTSAGASPLWNMVNLFPGLPDVHVLAALFDPPRRDEHFARAAELGTPVVADGFTALADWTADRAARQGWVPLESLRP